MRLHDIQTRIWLATVVGLVCVSGASCPRGAMWANPYANLPPALPETPTLEQVVQAVNHNNGQIQSLTTTQASLRVAGAATSLKANLAYERPRRLRLRADLLMSPELDLGSNDELFWFWVKRAEPQAVYFCRHSQFEQSAARQMTPVEPQWLIDALGVTEMDPAAQQQGPFHLPGGRVEVVTFPQTPQGTMRRSTIVDLKLGVIAVQRLYDPQGRLLVEVKNSGHLRDPLTGLWIPGVVELVSPIAQFGMRLDLGNVRVNQPVGDPNELWSLPRYPGATLVDLADPNFRPPAVAAAQAMQAAPPSVQQAAWTTSQPSNSRQISGPQATATTAAAADPRGDRRGLWETFAPGPR